MLHSTSQSRRPGRDDPLALALVDSLQLCVLQEPLSDPSVPHMKTLLFRLEVRGRKPPQRSKIPSFSLVLSLPHTAASSDTCHLLCSESLFACRSVWRLCWWYYRDQTMHSGIHTYSSPRQHTPSLSCFRLCSEFTTLAEEWNLNDLTPCMCFLSAF